MRYLRKIKRIIEWLPVLWRTTDWDWGYMLEIWQYSLERLDKECCNGHHVQKKAEVRKRKTAIELLKRLKKDDYVDYSDPEDKKFTTIDNWVRDLNVRKSDGYYKVAKARYEHGKYLYKQDIELFGTILKTQLRRWWD